MLSTIDVTPRGSYIEVVRLGFGEETAVSVGENRGLLGRADSGIERVDYQSSWQS
jgi:hypothetical protein